MDRSSHSNATAAASKQANQCDSVRRQHRDRADAQAGSRLATGGARQPQFRTPQAGASSTARAGTCADRSAASRRFVIRPINLVNVDRRGSRQGPSTSRERHPVQSNFDGRTDMSTGRHFDRCAFAPTGFRVHVNRRTEALLLTSDRDVIATLSLCAGRRRRVVRVRSLTHGAPAVALMGSSTPPSIRLPPQSHFRLQRRDSSVRRRLLIRGAAVADRGVDIVGVAPGGPVVHPPTPSKDNFRSNGRHRLPWYAFDLVAGRRRRRVDVAETSDPASAAQAATPSAAQQDSSLTKGDRSIHGPRGSIPTGVATRPAASAPRLHSATGGGGRGRVVREMDATAGAGDPGRRRAGRGQTANQGEISFSSFVARPFLHNAATTSTHDGRLNIVRRWRLSFATCHPGQAISGVASSVAARGTLSATAAGSHTETSSKPVAATPTHLRRVAQGSKPLALATGAPPAAVSTGGRLAHQRFRVGDDLAGSSGIRPADARHNASRRAKRQYGGPRRDPSSALDVADHRLVSAPVDRHLRGSRHQSCLADASAGLAQSASGHAFARLDADEREDRMSSFDERVAVSTAEAACPTARRLDRRIRVVLTPPATELLGLGPRSGSSSMRRVCSAVAGQTTVHQSTVHSGRCGSPTSTPRSATYRARRSTGSSRPVLARSPRRDRHSVVSSISAQKPPQSAETRDLDAEGVADLRRLALLHLPQDPGVQGALAATFAASTWKSYAAAWRSYIVTRRLAGDSPWPLSATVLFRHILQIAAASSRPAATIAHLQAAVGFLHELRAVVSPWSDPGTAWFRLAIRGIVRAETTADATSKAILDVRRVLRWLASVASSSLSFEQQRDNAIAAAASVLPSRRSEWAALEADSVTLSLAATQLGQPPRRACLVNLAPFDDASIDDLSKRDFDVDIRFSKSKTDHLKRKGMLKPLFHAAGEQWSPALQIVRYAAARSKLPRLASSRFFVTATGNDMAASTVSNRLAAVATAATGERATSHSYRSGAASYLLALGISAELVAALGGWQSPRAIVQHYARHHRPDDDLVKRMSRAMTTPPQHSTRRSAVSPHFSSPVYASPGSLAASPIASPPYW